MMRVWRVAVAVALLFTVAACDDSSSTTTSPGFTVGGTAGPVTAVTVTSGTNSTSGTSATTSQVMPGRTVQLAATAAYGANASQDVTSLATWSSSNPAVASVSTTGLVTGRAVGEADIFATYQSVTGSTHVSVTN